MHLQIQAFENNAEPTDQNKNSRTSPWTIQKPLMKARDIEPIPRNILHFENNASKPIITKTTKQQVREQKPTPIDEKRSFATTPGKNNAIDPTKKTIADDFRNNIRNPWMQKLERKENWKKENATWKNLFSIGAKNISPMTKNPNEANMENPIWNPSMEKGVFGKRTSLELHRWVETHGWKTSNGKETQKQVWTNIFLIGGNSFPRKQYPKTNQNMRTRNASMENTNTNWWRKRTS